MANFDRHRDIEDARKLFWKGHHDSYSPELWVSLLDAQDVARANMQHVQVVFGGEVHTVTLTDVEDLLKLVRQARVDIALARQGKLANVGA